MRSKEVEEAIESLKEHTKTYLDEFTTDFQDDFMGKVKTVLNYISELEKQSKIKILVGRGNGKTTIIAEAIKAAVKEKAKNKKAIEYIKEKQKIQYKYSLSQIECEELLAILQEEEAEEEEYLKGE